MKTFTKLLQLLLLILLLAVASRALAQATLLTEGWESASVGTTPPAGWAVDTFTYGIWTSWAASGVYPAVTPYEGFRMTIFDSWDAAAGYQNRLKRITAINTVGLTNITVDFSEYKQTTYSNGDGITVQWSTNGTTWTTAGTNWSNYGSSPGWVVNTQALPSGASNQATLYIAFLFTSQYGYDVYLDLCHVKGLQTGTVTGNVRDFLTNFPLAGVSISCGGIGPVLSNAAGAYTINSVPYGYQVLTAAFPGYLPYTETILVGGKSTTHDIYMHQIPAVLTGIVTDCINNAPIFAAKIVINGQTCLTTTGGHYSVNVYTNGYFPVTFHHPGYHDTTTTNVQITSGSVTTLNICLRVLHAAPSQPFSAVLNSSQTAVSLTWGTPAAPYDLPYDDGIQDTNTVWAVANNMNAVKFTPVAYPVTVSEGYVDIGEAYDYPNGTTVASLIPFTMQVYDASGTGGTPGVALGTPITVTPVNFGWNYFNITGVSITSGNFWLVMKQAGTPPNACRLAVDTSSNQLRSWQKNGSGPWLPVSGNFMIRSNVIGPGGPPEDPGALLGYQVYRLFVQDQGNPMNWVPVNAPVTNSSVDFTWPALPDSCFMWAVMAHYGGTSWSTAILSNSLCKNHSVNVTVNVTPTCASTPQAGSEVSLSSLPPYGGMFSYNGITNPGGTVNFTGVQKSPYLLSVSRPGYDTYNQNVSVYANHVYNISLLQTKYPASNARIDNKSLFMHWTPPGPHIFALNDDFTGGFAPNAWVNPTGYWQISTDGNPGNCAEYSWLHFQTNYSTTLTSKTLVGIGATDFKLYWDISLSDYAGDGNEQLDVEIQSGGAGAWTSLKHYSNTGNISWQTDSADLAPYTNNNFRIRFNAHGVDAFNINNWDVDNVKVFTTIPDPAPCILAYNIYLDGVMDGTSTDTSYTIPGSHCVYGNTYTACVKAVYGSGTSASACTDTFVARWLCPPTNFAGQAIEATAYLTWNKPACGGQLINYIFDSGVMGNGLSINPGYNIQMGNYFPLPSSTAGMVMSFDIMFTSANGSITANTNVYIYGPGPAHALLGMSDTFSNGPASAWPTGSWVHVTCTNGIAFTGPFYALVNYNQPVLTNYMGLDVTTSTYDPQGLAWANYAGAWGYATTTFGLTAPETFIIRATCFVYGKDKAGEYSTIDPSTIGNVSPVPAAANKASATNISQQVGDPHSSNAPATVTLLGYNIMRDGTPLPYISDPNRLYYYDNNLDYGVYHYLIMAYYDVSPVPPLHDYSPQVGPVTVTINGCSCLPFCERWDQGSFAFNNWSSVGNWSVNTASGNPLPCADFSWQPVLNNYNDSLASRTFETTSYSCAKIYLDFDYKLLDKNQTGAEFLTVEKRVNGVWKKIDEYSNHGDVPWTSKHFELPAIAGKALKVRFRAHGAHSSDILHWYVDNICMYAVCQPPLSLNFSESHLAVTLSWQPPDCNNNGPASQWIHWDDGVNFNSIGTCGGCAFDIAAHWTPDQISQLNGGSVTKIAYFPSSAGSADFRARVWQGAAGNNLLVDQAIPTVIYDHWNTVVLTTPPLIDVTQDLWIGVNINFFSGWVAGCDNGPAIDGFGDMVNWQGAWATLLSLCPSCDYNWNLQAYIETLKSATIPVILAPPPVTDQTGPVTVMRHPVGSGARFNIDENANSPQGRSVIAGYNVYRTNTTADTSTFHKINTSIVADTSYTDNIYQDSLGTYKYYVTTIMNDSVTNTFLCESPAGNILTVSVPAVGVVENGAGQVMIFPNPATDNVNVTSDFIITSIEVINYTGQTVSMKTNVRSKATNFSVAELQAGIYFVKISTHAGSVICKITIAR